MLAFYYFTGGVSDQSDVSRFICQNGSWASLFTVSAIPYHTSHSQVSGRKFVFATDTSRSCSAFGAEDSQGAWANNSSNSTQPYNGAGAGSENVANESASSSGFGSAWKSKGPPPRPAVRTTSGGSDAAGGGSTPRGGGISLGGSLFAAIAKNRFTKRLKKNQ